MSGIEWHNETRALSALTPWADNPAEISAVEAERLLESLRDFGQVSTIAIEPDGTICDGHQRRQVWAASREYGPDYEVAVRVASRKLTRKEREKLAVLLRTAQGHFDWEKLSAWDANELQGWGLDADTLRGWDDAAANLREMLAASSVEALEDFDFGNIPQEDRAPFRQMTFTLHDTQAEQVEAALKAAKAMGEFTDSPNENSNGNALARICETFLSEYGNG